MITAWVLYYDQDRKDKYECKELTGSAGYDSRSPSDWGLPENCVIELVLQQGSFINAWVQGKSIKTW